MTPRTAESTVGSAVAEAGTRAPITLRAQEQAVTRATTRNSPGAPRDSSARPPDGGDRTPAGLVRGRTASSILRGPFQKGFLGYWVSSSPQGLGHTSRAVGLALRVAEDELDLHRLEAHTQLENLASQAVLRKHGFSSWGIAHEHFYADGGWHDEVFWERKLARRISS
ncbi:GNAT family N-acetyltransferase [Streptomyces sp. NPDC058108]|uniref:GNAT family N-acetyltransferase n=1 Tax=Streptomyces sp. NPDC058108 TaxID=3346344 RepID=UPI0036E2DE18